MPNVAYGLFLIHTVLAYLTRAYLQCYLKYRVISSALPCAQLWIMAVEEYIPNISSLHE